MREDVSFVLHIRANPDDETARLIYADYLEERGDPRGELIRVQCELARLGVEDPLLPELTAREEELLAAHAEDWLAPLREMGVIGVNARCFRRGLIERIVITAADFTINAEAICTAEPGLYGVQLKDVRGGLNDLVAAKVPEQVRRLDLSSNALTEQEMSALKSVRWWGQLEELNLAFNRLQDAAMMELAAIHWPRLETLSLARNGITHTGAASLARTVMPRLRSLSLALNPLGWMGVHSLVTWWRQIENIEELDLTSTDLGADGPGGLAWRHISPRLKRLILRSNRIGNAGMRNLADQPDWSLSLLDLRNNVIAPRYEQQPGASMAKEFFETIVPALLARYGKALVL